MLAYHWKLWPGTVPVLSWMPWKMLLMLAFVPGLVIVFPVTVAAMLPVSVAEPELPDASSMPKLLYWRIWLLVMAIDELLPAGPPGSLELMPAPPREPQVVVPPPPMMLFFTVPQKLPE